MPHSPPPPALPEALIASLRSELASLGSEAISALRLTLHSEDDGPRVRAAEAVLDRIGVSRSSEKPSSDTLAIPPEMLLSLVNGFASMFGKALSEDAYERARAAIERARDVTPPAEGRAPVAPVTRGAQPMLPPTAPEDRRRARRSGSKAKRAVANIPNEVLEEMEDEGEG